MPQLERIILASQLHATLSWWPCQKICISYICIKAVPGAWKFIDDCDMKSNFRSQLQWHHLGRKPHKYKWWGFIANWTRLRDDNYRNILVRHSNPVPNLADEWPARLVCRLQQPVDTSTIRCVRFWVREIGFQCGKVYDRTNSEANIAWYTIRFNITWLIRDGHASPIYLFNAKRNVERAYIFMLPARLCDLAGIAIRKFVIKFPPMWTTREDNIG